MTRIECNCQTCQDNATRLGMAAPLRADVPNALLAKCRGAKGRHGLVYSAHDPSAVGVAVRRTTSIRPA